MPDDLLDQGSNQYAQRTLYYLAMSGDPIQEYLTLVWCGSYGWKKREWAEENAFRVVESYTLQEAYMKKEEMESTGLLVGFDISVLNWWRDRHLYVLLDLDTDESLPLYKLLAGSQYHAINRLLEANIKERIDTNTVWHISCLSPGLLTAVDELPLSY